jgi:hypothetical protein
VSYIDNDDQKTYTFDVDLEKVEVKFPEKDNKEIKVSDAVGIVMRYPPAVLYSNKEFLESQGADLVDKLIRACIDKVYDSKQSEPLVWPGKSGRDYTELQSWIDNLDIKSYDKIREFLNSVPSLHYEIKYSNANGKERTITLTTLNDFFTLA